jgi:hypothetical protein
MKPLYIAIFVFIGIFIVLLMSTPPTSSIGWDKLTGDALYPAVLIGLGALALEKKKAKTDDLLAVPPKKDG